MQQEAQLSSSSAAPWVRTQRIFVPPSSRPYAAPRRARRPARRRIIILAAACVALAGAVTWKGGAWLRLAHAADNRSALDSPMSAQRTILEWRMDRLRRKRVGKASFYAHSFDGRTMADGTPMRPKGNNAASRTLPLGTTAMVTNLENGKTAIVTIRDRGPYVAGRIVDLSPATAQKIGLTPQQGITKVEVAPLEVPMPDGTIKPGLSDVEAHREDMRVARLNP